MTGDETQWFDEAAGPLVRPYAMTGGRTRPGAAWLDVATQVVTVPSASERLGLGPEHQAILDLCHRALSVAELASYVNVPLVVIKVLISDLMDRGDVVVRPPAQALQAPGRDLLQAVLDGVRAL
ncbi:DUF742 domain-containing protein [Kutzneria buriramensis]|jgi:hypothetical protein|uniref:Uncharacterized protein DUF742 n=1 Tax=Kutzneria buriramensis TaxID=1045776 RepID=A0A3E0HQL9_9PSEU|nr:DUF742 domain-containing protein [Kutzneria buriramensis]REH48570.1 uncharacterized protein DUF742 [Kutzneria buriramensis]